MSGPKVLILMGSDSDWEVMSEAKKALDELGVPAEVHVSSAHRTPERTAQARPRGGRPRHRGARLRRRRGGPPRRRLRGRDRAAGPGRAARRRATCRASTPSSPPPRCRPACRSGRSPSARPARGTPGSSPRASSPAPIPSSRSGCGPSAARWRREVEAKDAALQAKLAAPTGKAWRVARPLSREGDPPPVRRGAPLPHAAPARDPAPRPGRRALRLGRRAARRGGASSSPSCRTCSGTCCPIAFLLGAVLGVGRLAEDREVVALGAAGDLARHGSCACRSPSAWRWRPSGSGSRCRSSRPGSPRRACGSTRS